MRRAGFWKTDWFLGVVVSLAMLALANSDLVQSLERKAYDWGVRASAREPLSRIAVIAIDETPIGVFIEWLGEQKRTRLSPVSLFCGPPLGFLADCPPCRGGPVKHE